MKQKIECRAGKRLLAYFMILCSLCGVGGSVFAASSDAAAGNSEQEEIAGNITVLGNFGEDEMQPYIEAFGQKYPQVEVTYEYVDDYENEIRNRMQEGDYGDVLLMPDFVQDKEYATYFEPLGRYDLLSQKYLYLDMAKYQGQIVYGLPSSSYMMGILYNQDVFYQAGITQTPKSIEEFKAALRDIKDRTDAIPFYTNYADAWALAPWDAFPYIEMTGNPDYKEIEFFNETDPFTANGTHYQVYKLLYDIVKEGLCESNTLMTNWQQSKEMLCRGQIGCIAIGSWAFSQFRSQDPEAAVAFMPFCNEVAGRQYMTVSTDYCYAISRNSENKEAAKAYLDFMLDESGYALDHDRLSIVRTDPYPNAYGEMQNIVLLSNELSTAESYLREQKLFRNIDIENGHGAKRIIEAAVGIRKESLEDILEEWSQEWKAAWTEDMNTVQLEQSSARDSIILGNYEVRFSQTEKEYLEERGVLKIGYLKNMAPYQYQTTAGFDGVSAQVCALLERETGLQTEYYPYLCTQDILFDLQNGTIEMAAGIDSSMIPQDTVRASKEYVEYMNVIVKNNSVETSALEESVLAAVEGEASAEGVPSKHSVLYYASLEEAVWAVERGEAGYTISDYYSADYYIKKQECSHVTMLPLAENSAMSLAFSKDVDTRLVSVSNKCLYVLQDGNMQVMLRGHMEPPAQPVTLRRFVEENPIPCLSIVTTVFTIICILIFFVMREKARSAKKHELDIRRYEVLSSMVDEYIFEYDRGREKAHFDKKFYNKFGIAEVVDDGTELEHNEVWKQTQEQYKLIENGNGMSPAFELTDLKGEKEWYRLLCNTVLAKDGKPQHVIGKLVNVQEEMQEKQQMQEKAMRDSLTGLYNREGFCKRYEALYDKMLPMAFAVMDVDDFKSVNDVLGHAGGDEALVFIAQKLRNTCPAQSIIARYGGDEFMVCIYGITKEEAGNFFEKLIYDMNREFTFQALSHPISISLGAVYSKEKLAYRVIFKEADKVLYKTKHEGKNGFRLIDHLEEV